MSFILINDSVSRDTVTACEQILDGAQQGQVLGIAFVLFLKRKRFMVDAVGEASRDPTLTRGAMLALDDELRDMVRSKRDSNTTF